MKTNSKSFFKVIQLALLCSIAFVPSFPSYGHLYGLNYQDWKNQNDGLHVQFETIPPTPTAGTPSVMNFSVQDLNTGKHIPRFNETITILSSDTSSAPNNIVHKFETKTIRGGDFSENYTFPSGGTYDIWLRIDAPTVINAAKFTVFVSSPQFQFLNMGLILFPAIIMVVIFGSVLIVVAHYVYKKNSSKKDKN
ncbi:MAG: hypothetical protein KGH85_07590 [Thaumarchaeota archaeon]|nr:hypothetical protein [Nitrososphaerota archaeon]